MTVEGKEFYLDKSVDHVILGREKKETPNYFQIKENNTISKQHAKIFWDDAA